MIRRARTVYFEREPGVPQPLRMTIRRRVRFNEADVMGIVWFGRYALYLEEAMAELNRRCGLSYGDFRDAGLFAPIAEYHVDYRQPLRLDEEFTISCSLIWNDGARLNTEYKLAKLDRSIAARAYTVQLFVGAKDGRVCLVTPPILERCRARWKAGEFLDLES